MQPKFVRRYDASKDAYIYDNFLSSAFRLITSTRDSTNYDAIKENYLKIASEEVERNCTLVERLKELHRIIKGKPNSFEIYLKFLKVLRELDIIYNDVYDDLSILPDAKKSLDGEKKFNLDDVINQSHPNKDIQLILKGIISNEIDSIETHKIKQKFFEEIKSALKKIDWEAFGKEIGTPNLSEYGSIVNSCSLKDSDLDVTFVTDRHVDERKLLEYIYLKAISKFEKKPGYKIDKLLTPHIRFPLLDITKEKKGKVSITVNNQLGVENSKLIETYMQISPRARVLTLLVKIWAKVHKRSGAKNCYPTSYAYNLLVISFLQKIEPPILPSLQKISRKHSTLEVKRRIKDEHQEFTTKIDFEQDLSVLEALMKKKYSKNEKDVIELLKDFFKFVCYTQTGDYNFSIKDAEWYPKIDNNDFLFSLEDPFDLKHDPGCHLKIGSNQQRDLYDDMKKSIKLIDSKKINEIFLPFV